MASCCSGDREPVIDSAHGQYADGTTWTVNQLDIRRKNVFQAKAINGVRMAAAHFHEAVMPAGVSEAANFFCGFLNQVRIAKLIDEFHDASADFTGISSESPGEISGRSSGRP